MTKTSEVLIITKNTNGIVARIMLLFNKRGYLVQKMTAGATNKEGYARLTLSVEGDEQILHQIQKQVYKIIDVVKVKIFPEENVLRRELMLVKVNSSPGTRSQIIEIANVYRGKILDVASNSIVIELTGKVPKLRGFLELMKEYGILEVARTGTLAMSRGEKI